jgi:hypothetical protein
MKREVVQEFLNLSGLEGLALIDGHSRPYYRGVEQILNSQQREALAEGIWQVLETIPDTFDAFEFQFTGTQIYIYKLSNGLILLILAKDNLLYPDYAQAVGRLRATFEEDSQATVETFRVLLSNAQSASRTLQFATFPGDVPLEGLDRIPEVSSSAAFSPAASPIPNSLGRNGSSVSQNGSFHVADPVTQRGSFAPVAPESLALKPLSEPLSEPLPDESLELELLPSEFVELELPPTALARELAPEPYGGLAALVQAETVMDAEAVDRGAGVAAAQDSGDFEAILDAQLVDLATLPRRVGDTDLLPVPAPLPTMEEWVVVLNALSQCATQYLGRAVIVNYWRVCRPEDAGLAGLEAQRSGAVIVATPDPLGVLDKPVTLQQQRKLQAWAAAFMGRCTQVIRDFPSLAEQSLSPEQVTMLDL